MAAVTSTAHTSEFLRPKTHKRAQAYVPGSLLATVGTSGPKDFSLIKKKKDFSLITYCERFELTKGNKSYALLGVDNGFYCRFIHVYSFASSKAKTYGKRCSYKLFNNSSHHLFIDVKFWSQFSQEKKRWGLHKEGWRALGWG